MMAGQVQRLVDTEHIEQYAQLTRDAFTSTIEDCRHYVDMVEPQNCRVLLEDDAVAAGLVLLPMGHYYGGREIPTAGIAAVAVAAQCRARGYARQLMTAALLEARERGMALSSLYPATVALYRKCGYGLAGSRFMLRVPLADLPRTERGFDIRPLAADEEELIRPVYAAAAQNQPGQVVRTPFFWHRVRRHHQHQVLGYAVLREGTVEGYVYFHVERTSDLQKRSMVILDFVATTPEATRALLGLIADHRSMIKDAVFGVGPAEPWVGLLDEQSYTLTHEITWMLRMVDVGRALELRGYPPMLATELHLDVVDELLPDNSGKITLRIEDGVGQVRRGGAGAMRIPVTALASLYSGFYNGTALRAAGLLEADANGVAKADAVFAGPPPWMRDKF
jgi:predicted acetyltransferase